MKYRHRYHAGNFADVHKHVALLALLQALQFKERGLLYLETHAGAGAYELADPSGRHGAEARQGVAIVLQTASLEAPELVAYREAVLGWRHRTGHPTAYPGSPLLAAQALRPQDRGVFYELQPPECRALERALHGAPRLRVECSDGYRTLAAHLPPAERRALILIDPPYEQPALEIEQALGALEAILQRLANAVVALWYPIKDERWLAAWQARARARLSALSAPATTLELWLYPRDAGVALNGSGLLLVNPPYRFDEAARLWQGQLRTLLEQVRPPGTPPGGDQVQVLVSEREAGHARA